VLHSRSDERLAQAVLARLKREPDLFVGDNEPYSGHLPGDSIDRHALGPGRLNVLIELRQDLIATEAQQGSWAERLSPILKGALEDAQGR
jgi:predicted N-formylglutamate amidohydrolase